MHSLTPIHGAGILHPMFLVTYRPRVIELLVPSYMTNICFLHLVIIDFADASPNSSTHRYLQGGSQYNTLNDFHLLRLPETASEPFMWVKNITSLENNPVDNSGKLISGCNSMIATIIIAVAIVLIIAILAWKFWEKWTKSLLITMRNQFLWTPR